MKEPGGIRTNFKPMEFEIVPLEFETALMEFETSCFELVFSVRQKLTASKHTMPKTGKDIFCSRPYELVIDLARPL